jgi:predicted DNA-binding transcriptional regulator AlpA
METPAPNQLAPSADALLTRRQVLARIGMGRTWLREAVLARHFPQPVRIGARVLWVEREVATWIAERVAERVAEREIA